MSSQWARTWGGTGQEESTRGIAVTNAGDSYFTGETTTFDVGLQDVCTVKFNSTGSLQWARTWGTSDNDIGRTTALDSSGNVYVAGATRPGAYLGFLVLKYDSSGSLLWERYWSCGGGNSEAYGLLVNSDNFVYATGYYGSGGIYEIPLVKFDTEGVFYWGESWNDEGTQDGYFLALDSLGLLIIGGSAPNNTGSWGSLTGSSGTPSGTESTPSGTVTSPTGTVTSPVGTEGSPTGTEDTGGGGYDALVLKLDADGL